MRQQQQSQQSIAEHSQKQPRVKVHSLLDITYPYLKGSMLSQSYFFGFQCLVVLIAIHFLFIYLMTNYLDRGYFLKWDVLLTIISNLVEDSLAILSGFILALCQIYMGDILITLRTQKKFKFKVVVGYCVTCTAIFVISALYLLSSQKFYFTDRIFIVVVSWALPCKTASYCLDRLNNHQSQPKSLLFKTKFIISPIALYSTFEQDHNPSLTIHTIYLIIKSITAVVCLLINYILLTEVISPYLEPSVYSSMGSVQLFFRITPLLYFEHMCLYYLIMENIMLAMAEITQLQTRRFYSDWWNSQTISEYLDKWVLLINAFSDKYLLFLNKQQKHSLHLTIIFVMLFSVFGQVINTKTLLFVSSNILVVYGLGYIPHMQNNYLVHLLIISYQPFCLIAILKYQLFK